MSNQIELNVLNRHHRWRMGKDSLAKYLIAAGGLMVIVSLVSIFVFLFREAIPMFEPAEIKAVSNIQQTSEQRWHSQFLALDEYSKIVLSVDEQGQARYFSTENGALLKQQALFDPLQHQMSVLAKAAPATDVFFIGFEDGAVAAYKNSYSVRFDAENNRIIQPDLAFPLGEQRLQIDAKQQPIRLLAGQVTAEQTTLAALTQDHRLFVVEGEKEENFLSGEVEWTLTPRLLETELTQIDYLLVNVTQNLLFLANQSGALHVFDIRNKAKPALLGRYKVQDGISAIELLSGGNSLVIASNKGVVSQWFHVKDENNQPVLTKIREFDEQKSVVKALAPEYSRKGFLTIDQQGQLGIHHATAGNTLLHESIEGDLQAVAVGPRANSAIVEDAKGTMHFFKIDNEHPEISWSVLWRKVWYEDYPAPEYIWQSSSASNDFEPKFSLVPITFGTIKAAVYAMLVAVPLAIFGAIYTAYFMTPALRKVVKPGIEIMEALPTVILGFLAGLWLAPIMEDYLPAFIVMLILLPVGTILFAYAWTLLPESIRLKVPEGYQAMLLVPVIIFLVWLAFALSPVIELLFFGGDIRGHITNEWGIDYSQRNALVVGLAMGFAVIPTIFSIAEDAIFAVPKHLTSGSLALGATPWQTLTRVVILNASPGIFSAVMMGLGRAVGETMIVLMATGNTPIMDWNIFEGFRTLSANIAEEMPESEVGSTHYRVLFLAALVLFVVTFVLNTIAEVVRQRLRSKYTSL